MKKHKVLKFKSDGPTKDTEDNSDIVDHGMLGDLEYKVYKRGTIHITGKNRAFRKDIHAFEDAIKSLDIDNMENGESRIVEGSGDTDHLTFRMKDGELTLHLSKRGFDMLEKLKAAINMGKAKKEAV